MVDAIAVMLEHGIIDETGRILDYDECADVPTELIERLTELDGMKAFRLAGRNNDEDIVITQKDIGSCRTPRRPLPREYRLLLRKPGQPLTIFEKYSLQVGSATILTSTAQ